MYNDKYTLLYHSYGNSLYHHGIKGQKHGQRRWQNPDGSLTPEGRVHYGVGEKIKRRVDDYFTPQRSAKIGATMATTGAIVSKISYDTRNSNIKKAKDALIKAKMKEFLAKNEINDMMRMTEEQRDKLNLNGNKIIANGQQATRDVLKAASNLAAAKSLATLTVPILGGAAALAGLGLISYGAYKAIKKRKEDGYV
jgi:hypothetical protein